MSSVKKKILIVGGKSKLAKNFMFFLKKKNIKFLYTEKKQKNKILYLNLRNVKSFKIPNNITSAVFFAYKSNINYCEENYNDAQLINVKNTFELAKKFLKKKIFVLFLSSNLVFNNSVKNRYEDTKKIPITNYGKMKSQAEDLIYKFCQKKKLSSYFSILRITKVLDKKFDPVLNWKKKINQGKVLKVPCDIYCCPINIKSLNNSIFKILNLSAKGIHHLSGKKEYSYYELVKKLFNRKVSNQQVRKIHSYDLRKKIINSNIKTYLLQGKNSKKIGLKNIPLTSIKKELNI